MNNYVSILAIFRQTYLERFGNDMDIQRLFNDSTYVEKLMSSLMLAVNTVIGYKTNTEYELSRIKYLCNNIVENLKDYNPKNLPEDIENYLRNINEILTKHPNVEMLLQVLQRVYSPDYDGKPGNYNTGSIESRQKQYVRYLDKYIEFGLINRRDNNDLPIIRIQDIDELEATLEEYFDEVSWSETFYNPRLREGFNVYDDNSIRMMLIEGTILNTSYYETYDINKLFRKYIEFVKCNGLKTLKNPHGFIIGENLDAGLCEAESYTDEDQKFKLIAFLKRSDVEYETPYYISLNVFNNKYVLELPNIRLGVYDEDGVKKAYILASQTSQANVGGRFFSKEASDLQNAIIKENIPKTSKYRYYNPNHLISLLITFGILKGLGIEDIEAVKKMPIRVYKTICDKGYNSEEAAKYILRINEKNVCTYQKIGAIIDGIEVISSSEITDNLTIKIGDNLTFPNEYLENLYNMGLDLGTRLREDNPKLN